MVPPVIFSRMKTIFGFLCVRFFVLNFRADGLLLNCNYVGFFSNVYETIEAVRECREDEENVILFEGFLSNAFG